MKNAPFICLCTFRALGLSDEWLRSLLVGHFTLGVDTTKKNVRKFHGSEAFVNGIAKLESREFGFFFDFRSEGYVGEPHKRHQHPLSQDFSFWMTHTNTKKFSRKVIASSHPGIHTTTIGVVQFQYKNVTECCLLIYCKYILQFTFFTFGFS